MSALRARTHFGKLLRQVEKERRSLIIQKRGTPRAVLLSLRDCVRLAAPEPDVLRVIGEESKAKGTAHLGLKKIADNMFIKCADLDRADYLGDRKHATLPQILESHQFSRVPRHRDTASSRLTQARFLFDPSLPRL